MKASDDLCQSVGDASEMVRQARILAQATSELVGTIKAQAEEQEDNEQQKKLLGAAKLLADATANMVGETGAGDDFLNSSFVKREQFGFLFRSF